MSVLSFIGALVIAGILMYWLHHSRQKESHHLDSLHISGQAGGGTSTRGRRES